MCHVLLAAPGLGLLLFLVLPLSVAGPLYAVVFVASALLYYLVWREMRRPVQIGPECIAGAVGEVVEADGRRARVLLDHALWQAVSPQALAAGDRVRVRAREGLELVVERMTESTPPNE